ncbi:MAG: biotin-dependent carboxyltransferase family protein [Candidatus Acidiferrum sp.]
MSSLVVESPGLLTTIQDLGRPGFGPIGVSPSGAADPVAARLGNLLVSNDAGAAVVEMTLLGGRFLFPDGAVIAVTGADLGATIQGRPVEMWTAQTVAPSTRITFGPTKDFARGYLAVAGGIKVPSFLGSASTHLLSSLGGHEGRALRKGDVLRAGEPQTTIPPRRISPAVLLDLRPGKILRVTDGPQIDTFSSHAKRLFFHSTFRVCEESDRTGLRLEGPKLTSKFRGEMITEGVPLGAIQVTPSGQTIILFVEQQTTGGYPKIANVIGVDLHRLGQLRPRDEIRFERTSLAVARSLWRDQERLLNCPERLFA